MTNTTTTKTTATTNNDNDENDNPAKAGGSNVPPHALPISRGWSVAVVVRAFVDPLPPPSLTLKSLSHRARIPLLMPMPLLSIQRTAASAVLGVLSGASSLLLPPLTPPSLSSWLDDASVDLGVMTTMIRLHSPTPPRKTVQEFVLVIGKKNWNMIITK